jgi:hypothetical protein
MYMEGTMLQFNIVGGHVLEMTEEKYCNLTENEFWKF